MDVNVILDHHRLKGNIEQCPAMQIVDPIKAKSMRTWKDDKPLEDEIR